ncbi:MAG: hypothetical protein WKF94_19230 [Solirubrobacteraceae bacterium]
MAVAVSPHDTAELLAADLVAPLRVISCAARSDRGARRPINEDALLVAAPAW